MKEPKPLPSQKELKKLLRYEPETGKLYWKKRPVAMFPDVRAAKVWNTRYSGKEVCPAPDKSVGYFRVTINYRKLWAHRVIWKYVTGEEPVFIDHVDGDRGNNRFENLRNVSRLENAKNRPLTSRSRSGVLGVRYERPKKRKPRWCASITVKGKRFHLGYFQEFEKAVEARRIAEVKYGYHKNHGRAPTGSSK